MSPSFIGSSGKHNGDALLYQIERAPRCWMAAYRFLKAARALGTPMVASVVGFETGRLPLIIRPCRLSGQALSLINLPPAYRDADVECSSLSSEPARPK
jgi:hypothetical protein